MMAAMHCRIRNYKLWHKLPINWNKKQPSSYLTESTVASIQQVEYIIIKMQLYRIARNFWSTLFSEISEISQVFQKYFTKIIINS